MKLLQNSSVNYTKSNELTVLQGHSCIILLANVQNLLLPAGEVETIYGQRWHKYP